MAGILLKARLVKVEILVKLLKMPILSINIFIFIFTLQNKRLINDHFYYLQDQIKDGL